MLRRSLLPDRFGTCQFVGQSHSERMSEASPRVFLVGAGPGNPGLLTLRAVECLAQADVVIYDRLVPSALLDHAPAQAERICVSRLPGAHAERYPQVEATLIEA